MCEQWGKPVNQEIMQKLPLKIMTVVIKDQRFQIDFALFITFLDCRYKKDK